MSIGKHFCFLILEMELFDLSKLFLISLKDLIKENINDIIFFVKMMLSVHHVHQHQVIKLYMLLYDFE